MSDTPASGLMGAGNPLRRTSLLQESRQEAKNRRLASAQGRRHRTTADPKVSAPVCRRPGDRQPSVPICFHAPSSPFSSSCISPLCTFKNKTESARLKDKKHQRSFSEPALPGLPFIHRRNGTPFRPSAYSRRNRLFWLYIRTSCAAFRQRQLSDGR